jgi:phosphatidylserine/phosphatidylglycerophosphate/cardiolipin synthase-like enzyme
MQKNAQVRTFVTGLGWMGRGVGSIGTALEELVRSTKHQLFIVAYAISDGAAPLFELVRQKLSEGVRVTFVVDRVADQHGQVPLLLCQMLGDYPTHFFVYDFAGKDSNAHLHAKVLIADRERAIIGSANLSRNGLVSFHELCVQIEGEAVDDVTRATERLLEHPFVRRITSKDLLY